MPQRTGAPRSLGLVLLLAALTGPLAAQDGAGPTPASTAGAPVPTASAPAEPELGALLEASRAGMEGTGAEAEAAKLRFAFLSRMLAPIRAAPGLGRKDLEVELAGIEARLSAEASGAETGSLDSTLVESLALRIAAIRAEREARVTHLGLLESELSSLSDELSASEQGRPGPLAAGVEPVLRLRGLKAASDAHMAAHREATGAIELLDRVGAGAAKLHRLLRLRHAAGEDEIEAKENLVREAKARAVAEADRLAEAAKLKQEAEAAWVDDKAKLEAGLAAASEPLVKRVLTLKLELADQTRSFAAEREELARARQDEALVQASRGEDELEFLTVAQVLRERVLDLAELTNKRGEVDKEKERLERDERGAESRLESARSQFDQILGTRRQVAAREADLLVPGIPKDKHAAAWVVRSMLARIEERETQIQELRDVRRRTVEHHKVRRRDLDALSDALRAEIDRIRQARRVAAQAAQAESEGARLDRLAGFADDLARGIRAGEPRRVMARVLERARRIVQRRSPWPPLLGMCLLAVLLYLFTVRVMRTVEVARQEAEHQADAYDAMHGTAPAAIPSDPRPGGPA